MRVLPFERLSFQSEMTITELRLFIKEPFGSRKFKNTKRIGRVKGVSKYLGESKGDWFKVSRDIKYRNSFLPVIEGEISESGSGSRIDVKMGLNSFVKIFHVIWLTFAFLGCVMVTVIIYFLGFIFPLWYVPYILLLFGVLLGIIPFQLESNKSKKELCKLFKANVISDTVS